MDFGITRDDIRKLPDNGVFTFLISNACNTGNYLYGESFTESWLRHPSGAIFTWGSMDLSYWDEDDVLERKLFEGLFRENNRSFSDVTNEALSELWKHYGGKGLSRYYWETYVSLGEPSLGFSMER